MTTSANVTATTKVSRRRRLMRLRPPALHHGRNCRPTVRASGSAPGCSCRSQRVADAAYRPDEARLTIGLGLAAQVPDVHVERLRRRLEVETPDALVDRVARHHDVRVGEQQLEQIELGLGQAELA